MSFGYQQWNGAGQTTLTVTDRTIRIVATYSVYLEYGQTSQIFTPPGWQNNASWNISLYSNNDFARFRQNRFANGFNIENWSGDFYVGNFAATVNAIVWRG